ncbi:hypothetical protein ACFX1T_038830 [Malus domestica]
METTLTITALHCHKCDPEYIRQLKSYLFTHIGSSPSEDLQTLLDPYTSLVAAICCAVDMVSIVLHDHSSKAASLTAQV